MSTTVITETLLKRLSGQFDLSMVTAIDLSNQNLASLEGIQALTNLEELTANRNCLSSVEPLGQVPKLKTVRLCDNAISDVSGLEKCEHLTIIALDRNRLQVVQSLAPLSRLTFIRQLSIEGNPLCSLPAHEGSICRLLPQMRCLNGQFVEFIDKCDKENSDKEEKPDFTKLVPPSKPWLDGYDLTAKFPSCSLSTMSKDVQMLVKECQKMCKNADVMVAQSHQR